MDLKDALRNGMRVVGPDNREYGTIERYDDSAAYVRGKRVPFAAIERLESDRLHVDTPELWGLTSPADTDSPAARRPTASADLGGEIRVPLLEEQLELTTREIDLGEVRIHKAVEEAEEVRRGQLNREDVEVQRVRVDRRVTEPETSRQEGDWLIIPVMEEVFVVEKHLMVTEEIRIRKRLVTEEAEVRETVRRERATVEDTRVPRAPLITETVMPGSRPDPTRHQATANDVAPSTVGPSGDDAAWEELHREIRDTGR
jgi:uncharacterized protein (TIGR02271 family)